MLSDHAEKIFSEDTKVPPSDRASATKKKDTLSVRQDLHARASMYGFLASVYLYPPTPDLVRRLTTRNFLEELAALFGEETVADLREFATGGQLNADFDYLEQEYMNLFAVPTGRYVTPFEDVYRGMTLDGMLKRGPLLGERAIAARRIYRQAGADMARACKELPTHIGVEFSFMHFLCEREAAVICAEQVQTLPHEKQRTAVLCDTYRELQLRFLNEHLNAWFPQLSLAIQANAKSKFYRGLAKITETFLDNDTAWLSAGSKSRSQQAS